MGNAGVGKSVLILALEHGLWTTAQQKFGISYNSIGSQICGFYGDDSFRDDPQDTGFVALG
jgi:hypothetical protein